MMLNRIWTLVQRLKRKPSFRPEDVDDLQIEYYDDFLRHDLAEAERRYKGDTPTT